MAVDVHSIPADISKWNDEARNILKSSSRFDDEQVVSCWVDFFLGGLGLRAWGWGRAEGLVAQGPREALEGLWIPTRP